MGSTIVIGLDFGTTYSGVSWGQDEGLRKVHDIDAWPGLGSESSHEKKVPSVISYKAGQVFHWGYEVTHEEEAFRWFKLLLEPKAQHESQELLTHSKKLLEKLDKTVEDVVTDYLGALWEFSKQIIGKELHVQNWDKKMSVCVVMTVPVGWSDSAVNTTCKIARAAGLPMNLEVRREPEAAVMEFLTNPQCPLKKDDVVLICDAGGGTVDLMTWRIQQTSPPSLKGCTESGSDFCGSAFVDAAFRNFVQRCASTQWPTLERCDIQKMMYDFERGPKFSFRDTPKVTHVVRLKGATDIPGYIKDQMVILEHERLKAMFDSVCTKSEKLVQDQLIHLELNEMSLDYILLIGGFGSSHYIGQRIKTAFSSQSVKVLRLSNGWSAVARGACKYGLEKRRIETATTGMVSPTVTSHISRTSYGIPCRMPFDPLIHCLQDKVFDPSSNTYYADNQVKWFVKRLTQEKGDRVTSGYYVDCPVTRAISGIGYFSYGELSFSEVVYFCDEQTPPPQLGHPSVRRLCDVNFKVSVGQLYKLPTYTSATNAKQYRDLDYSLQVMFKDSFIGFQIVCGDRILAQKPAVVYSSIT